MSAFAPARRNILLIVADDLGLTLGCYDDPNARTPNLDRLAREGTRFVNAFATTASCSPSRSVMLTGLYNHTNGQYGLGQADHNFYMKPNVVPCSRLVKAAGYKTAVIGKFHVNPPAAFQWDLKDEGDTFDVASLAARVKKFAAGAGEQPWYIHLGFGDPHRGPGARFHVDGEVTFDAAKIRVPAHLPDTAATRADLAEYYTAVEKLDRGVGLVLDSINLEETLVVFISDNGMPMPNAKTTLYDAGVHLPMIARVPGAKKGVVSRAMVSYTDLVPTFLDWAQAKGPAYALPGKSFLPVVEQADPAGWDKVYLSHTFHGVNMYYPMRGVRTKRFKYLRNLYPELTFPHASDLSGSATWQGFAKSGAKVYGKRPIDAYLHRPAEELYDVVADPDEVKNLAADPAHRATLEALRADVLAWRKSTKDPWLQ